MTDISSFKMMPVNMWQLKSNFAEQKLLSIKPEKEEGKEGGEVKKVCQEFESLFLNYLLQEMRDTIPKSGLLDGGQAERIYTSMFDEKISKELAQKGGIGLAQVLEKSLLQYRNNPTNR